MNIKKRIERIWFSFSKYESNVLLLDNMYNKQYKSNKFIDQYINWFYNYYKIIYRRCNK